MKEAGDGKLETDVRCSIQTNYRTFCGKSTPVEIMSDKEYLAVVNKSHKPNTRHLWVDFRETLPDKLVVLISQVQTYDPDQQLLHETTNALGRKSPINRPGNGGITFFCVDKETACSPSSKYVEWGLLIVGLTPLFTQDSTCLLYCEQKTVASHVPSRDKARSNAAERRPFLAPLLTQLAQPLFLPDKLLAG